MRFRDPVCGMEIRWEEAFDYAVVGPLVVYFCCPGCASLFRDDPAGHVDVDEWLSHRSGAGASRHCAREPLDLAGDDVPAHRCLSRGAVPRIGTVSLDEFEALVVGQWRRLLGSAGAEPFRARVLERALLVGALTNGSDGRAHALDRMLAAEVCRLRAKEMERPRAEEELRLLPRAFAAALREVGVAPGDRERLNRGLEEGTEEVRAWIRRRPVVPNPDA